MERNEKEFERIVQTHKTTIYTVCYMFSKNEEEVNDLFQDTLVNLWKGMESFKGNCKLETWIYRVALNTCITHDRKKKRARERIPLEMEATCTRTRMPTRAKCRCCTTALAGWD